MSMSTFEAAAVVHKLRGEAIVVNTMAAMMAISAISPSPLNIASVPLMGGAGGLGLGLALAQPDRQVIILDGDASLLMELGGLAQIAGEAPTNLTHVVFNNNAQFHGVANLERPGGASFDFCAVAKGAGFGSVAKYGDMAGFAQGLGTCLASDGPHFIELEIATPPKFTRETPQVYFADLQFGRMGTEARAMMDALGTTR